MSASRPMPMEDSNYLRWIIQKPHEVAAYLEMVRAMQNLTIVVTKDGVTKTYAVMWSSSNGVVSINV